MNRIKEEFSRFANEYQKLNIIQKKVAKHISQDIQDELIIVDLGCGSGTLLDFYHNYKYYYGLDFSQEMLNLHPKSEKIELKRCDFNKAECFNYLENIHFDLIISLSAIQWAKDLDFIFSNIAKLHKNFILAIFTSNTFKTIHKTANISSPIYSLEEILNSAKKYLNFNYEVLNYELKFNEKKEMFKYIKNSGVSGNRNVLNFKDTKNLISNYPLDFLEFEIVVLKG
jgi:malonyl-CoA O-methyltransferase